MVTVERLEQLEKENKNLRLENADLMWERDGLRMTVDKLKEENQTLELWLDNKEKLNEEYRKQIDKYKSDLWEQYAEWWGLMDEIDYRKRECKKLKSEYEKYREHTLSVEWEPDLYEDVWSDELIYEEWLYD